MNPATRSKRLILILTATLGSPFFLHASTRDLDGDGIPNISDSDVDADGIPNRRDRNIDGGRVRRGLLRGRYVGDHLKNDSNRELDIDGDGLKDDSDAEKDIDGDGLADDSKRERDIDGDGRPDDSPRELDIDGDGRPDDSPRELDIDGDGRPDDSDRELDIDGDGRLDDSPEELDIDGDGRPDDSPEEHDIDGDGLDDDDAAEDDTDGDGRHDGFEDDDGDGVIDELDDDDDDDDGDGIDDENEFVAIEPGIVGDGSAPADLTGLSYLFAKGDDEETQTLAFTSGTDGEKLQEEESDEFTYNYAPDSSTAVVTLTYRPGKYDEFTFDFATGGFIRKRFERERLARTDSGNFALVEI
jgi:hypothetical protein